NPLAMITELVEHNLSLWKSVNDRFQKPHIPPETVSELAPLSQQVAQADSSISTSAQEKPRKTRKDHKD
nr:hypothetical protein [Candidatus Competibacter phosphatis]